MVAAILQLDFYALGSGVAEGIHQRFPTDSICFVADHRVQSSGAPCDCDSITDLRLDGEFLAEMGKRLFQIERVTFGRSDTANCISAFFYDLPDQIEDAAEQRFGGRIGRQVIDRRVELHGSAEKSLQ